MESVNRGAVKKCGWCFLVFPGSALTGYQRDAEDGVPYGCRICGVVGATVPVARVTYI
jgi:hypothetical protein